MVVLHSCSVLPIDTFEKLININEKMNSDCQMQPLDLSRPRPSSPAAAAHSPPSSAMATPVVEPAAPPPTILTPPSPGRRPEADERPLNLTGSNAGRREREEVGRGEAAVDSATAVTEARERPVSGGPARKRFLTKYLHKDRGEWPVSRSIQSVSR